MSKVESELMQEINRGVPPGTQARYDELIAKRQSETLTPDEYEELLSLTDEVEKLDAQRVEHLKELAGICGMTLNELMEDIALSKAMEEGEQTSEVPEETILELLK